MGVCGGVLFSGAGVHWRRRSRGTTSRERTVGKMGSLTFVLPRSVERRPSSPSPRLSSTATRRQPSRPTNLEGNTEIPGERTVGKKRRIPRPSSRESWNTSRLLSAPPLPASTFGTQLTTFPFSNRYLRKALFPLHPSLRLAGLLPPLDCPHHLRRDDASPFREGVVVSTSSSDERPSKKRKGGNEENAPSGRVMVDVGLWDPIEASGGEGVANATRVTVRMPSPESPLGASSPSTSCSNELCAGG